MFCLVRGCQYSHTHITSGHQCGKCKRFGHGQCECNNYQKIASLNNKQRIFNVKFPTHLHCTIEDCRNKQNHSTNAHVCFGCKKRIAHKLSDCSSYVSHENQSLHPSKQLINIMSRDKEWFLFGTDTEENIKLILSEIGNVRGKIVVCGYIGMGNFMYYRRDDIHSNFEEFYMDNDNRGQYAINDIPHLNAFVNNYVFIPCNTNT